MFLSGVIQGSHLDHSHHPQNYRDELRALLAEVHPEAEVICPFDLNPGSSDYSDRLARTTFFKELELAASADVTIAYAPVATMGTALEMYRSHQAGKLVFVISPMARNWAVRFLATEVFADLAAFEGFVRGGSLAAALAAHRGRVGV